MTCIASESVRQYCGLPLHAMHKPDSRACLHSSRVSSHVCVVWDVGVSHQLCQQMLPWTHMTRKRLLQHVNNQMLRPMTRGSTSLPCDICSTLSVVSTGLHQPEPCATVAMATRQSTSPAAAMARTSAMWCLATRRSSSLQMLACLQAARQALTFTFIIHRNRRHERVYFSFFKGLQVNVC